MAKKGPKKGSMHIKQHTAGTSNELSFSVLDAKRDEAAPVSGLSPRDMTELGRVSLFTLPGKQPQGDSSAPSGFGMAPQQRHRAASGATSFSYASQSEVVFRKHRRSARRIVAVLGAIALVGVVVFAGTRIAGVAFERTQRSSAAIDEAYALLESSDEAILALDSAVAMPAQGSNSVLNDRLSSLAAVESLLDRAINRAEEVSSQKSDSEYLEVASQIKEAAIARKDLVEKGRISLVQGKTAKRGADLAMQAWEQTMSADAAARSAVADANPSNYDIAAAQESVALFQDALVLVRQAMVEYPQADFSLFETYLEKRGNALQNAIACAVSLRSGDEAASNANAIAYNNTEQEAAQIASSLPDNPAQPILDVFGEEGADADEAYQEARKRASRADAALRALTEP